MKIIIIFSLFLSLKSYSQVENFKQIQIGKDTLFFSENFVSNREYLTFIIHNQNIVGYSFPYEVFRLFPSSTLSFDSVNQILTYSDKNFFEVYCSQIDPNVKDYFLNPTYLDYPVIGVSQENSLRYAKWFTDRLNEYQLIKNKIIKIDFQSEVDDNRFTTETFLFGQQYVPNETTSNLQESKQSEESRLLSYNTKYFIPNLRLPTFLEMKKINKKVELKKCNFNNSFLKLWSDSFLFLNSSQDLLKIKIGDSFLIFKSKKNIPMFDKTELLISKNDNEGIWNLIKIDMKVVNESKLWDNAPKVKDSIGYLDFVIISKNEYNQLMTIPFNFNKFDKKSENKPFRLVFNKRITSGLRKEDFPFMVK